MNRLLISIIIVAWPIIGFAAPNLSGCLLIGRYLAGEELPLSARFRLKANDFDLSVDSIRLNDPDKVKLKGSFNSGVFRTHLKGKGSVVVKLALPSALPPHEEEQYVPLESSHELREYVLIHTALAEIGLAPRFHGYLLSDQAESLGASLKAKGLKVGPGPFTGLVMDEIRDAWMVKSIPDVSLEEAPPEFVKRLDQKGIEGLLHKMRSIEGVLDKLRIQGDDCHFFITVSTDGNLTVRMADLDRFRIFRTRPVKNNFVWEMRALVGAWERASGKKMAAADFEKITGQPRTVGTPIPSGF